MGIFEKTLAQDSRKTNGFTSEQDRRQSRRLPQLQASHTSMTSNLWELEMLPAIALDRLRNDIIKLAANSLEDNIFFEVEVLLSAWPRLTSLLAPHGSWMLCLWETVGENRHLRLFMPVRLNKIGLPGHQVLQPLSNEFTPIGTPLVHSECAGEACEVLFQLLGDPKLDLPELIEFTHQRQSGPTYKALVDAATNHGLPVETSNTYQRAALSACPDPDSFIESIFGKKKMHELQRQYRRLSENGEVKLHSARSEEDALDAFENFMRLELLSWKGRSGTSLYNHKKIAAFSRQIIAELAANKGCEIFSLKQSISGDEKTLASLIFLGRNGRLVPWKMTYDENFSAYSPGMQIMYRATKKLVQRKDFLSADSLATADHWMMNTVWPDRITITDLTVGLAANSGKNLKSCMKAKNRYLRLKAFAKDTINSVQALKKKLK